MKKYSGIPELLEQYMVESGTDERWVTVHELRQRFGLTRYQYNTISGFLRRLEFRSFGQCPCIVLRIEKVERTTPSDPPKCRYRVKRKDMTTPTRSAHKNFVRRRPASLKQRNKYTSDGLPDTQLLRSE